MSTDNAKLEFEGGQNAFAMMALSDSGDSKVFASGEELWSQAAGVAPVVRPDGLLTGGKVSPAAGGGNNNVDHAAFTANVNGEEIAVPAGTDLAITRASTDTHIVNSIVCSAAGVVSVVAGTESTSFVETRGAAGGPPYIPVGSIELAQVRLNSATAGPIKASDVFDLVNRHTEKADFPVPSTDFINGNVEMSSALPKIHTGDLPKGVHASFATPEFIEAFDSYDFVPSETGYSSSSTQTYSRVKNSRSQSLSNATFSILLKDGITDTLVGKQGENLYFRFYPDKFKPFNIIEQGVFSIARSFPAGGDVTASCTINVDEKGKEVAL